MVNNNSYHHIENITKKNLDSVDLKSFKNKFTNEILYNLTFKSSSNNGYCSNTIVLTEEQKNKLKLILF